MNDANGYDDVSVPISPIDALKVSAEGFSVTERDPPSAMSESLRKEVIRIATLGDTKNKGAFTVNVAAHIERLVNAGREILLAEKVAANDLEALLQGRRRRGMNGFNNYGSTIEYLGDDAMMGTPLSNTSPTENFGTSAIRQIVDAMKAQAESPEKLVNALVAARAAGLHDVATALEAKLGITTPPPKITDEELNRHVTAAIEAVEKT